MTAIVFNPNIFADVQALTRGWIPDFPKPAHPLAPKETARYKWVFIVTELFNFVVNDSDAKKSAGYSRVLVVPELVVSANLVLCTIRRVYGFPL